MNTTGEGLQDVESVNVKLNLKTGNVTGSAMLSVLNSFYYALGLASLFILRGRKICKIFVKRGCDGMKRCHKNINGNKYSGKMTSLG